MVFGRGRLALFVALGVEAPEKKMTRSTQSKIEDRARVLLNELKVLQIEFRNSGMPISADKTQQAIDLLWEAINNSRKGKKRP